MTARIKWKPLWGYIRERENIRTARVAGKPWPWTKDEILKTFSFTNVKRIHDRTTQAFLRVYQVAAKCAGSEALLNCALRRFTGTVEASHALGWVGLHANIEQTLKKAESSCDHSGVMFWTGAYMIRGGDEGVPKYKAVTKYLSGLQKRAGEISEVIERTRSWEQGFHLCQELYGWGGAGFMAKEVLQDYLLWRECAGLHPVKDAETFTPIGPGARRGLNRLLGRGLTEGIKTEYGNMLISGGLLPNIQPLWLKEFKNVARLTSHDIQFCLCELDKYERVRLGEGRPRSLYHRKEA